MARKAARKHVLLRCTVLAAIALLLCTAAEPVPQDNRLADQSILGVEKFQESADAYDKTEHGKQLYQEAIQLLKDSSFQINQRVFIKQQSSLARSFLSDELQKQKGILPTALRLVTQGFMSFFTAAPAPAPRSTSASGDDDSTRESAMAAKRHRNPMIARAMELLETAGFEHENDDALFTLANIHFHGQYKAKRDLAQAFDMYAELADRSGNATAQQMVGFMYSTGLGDVVERDEAKAVLYTTFAAWGNSTAAELTMGYKYMLGIGTKKSCQDSVVFYKRAADKAHAKFLSGPPLGRTMPPLKGRLMDGEGGTYGAGASGPGNPPKEPPARDIKDYIEFHRFIAESDSPQTRDANYQLGIIYYTGNAASTTIPRDYQKAGKYLRKVADMFYSSKTHTHEEGQQAGFTAALLGKMYWRGEGYEVDEEQALKWFKKGVALDNAMAYNALGTMYMRGAAGLPVDHARAIEYFKKAADQKHSDAMVNMGLIYLNDPKFHLQAYQMFHDAAIMQNFQAIYHLGEMYYHGLGVTKKCDEAARYFKYVAERGDWDDILFPNSFEAYEAGDVEYAAIGYLQAAERGYEIGQSNFAWIVDRELPTSHFLSVLTSPSRSAGAAIAESALTSLGSPSRLLEMALVYWTRSANQGDVDARVKMGDYYFSGIGTAVDYKKATACYQVAAEVESSAMAMWNLGWMHENGVGVAKDYHLAKRWYDRSLSTNGGALLPVTLSLVKLHARFLWSYLTGGESASDAGSFWSIGGKQSSTLEGGEKHAAGDKGSRGSDGSDGELGEVTENGMKQWRKQQQQQQQRDEDGGEFDEADPFKYQRKREDDDEDMLDEEDDLVESLVIIGLCMVVGYLMYVRQFRFANNPNQNPNLNGNQNGNANANAIPNANNQNNNNQLPGVEGLPGDPNAPGRYAYYAAGG